MNVKGHLSELFFALVSHLCLLEGGLGTGCLFISQWLLHFLRVYCSGKKSDAKNASQHAAEQEI